MVQLNTREKVVKLFAWALCAAFLMSCSQDVPCSEFTEGEFKLGTSSDVRILRSGNTQKEYSLNPDEDFIDEYRINWLDECTYSATLEKTNRPESTSLAVGDSMMVKITDAAHDRYEWEGHVKGEIKKGIMIKVD